MIDIAEYKALLERGLLCSLWGTAAKDMTREELLIFVGMLDELVQITREGRGPKQN